MCEKLRILDDICLDLGLGYGTRDNVLFVNKSNPEYLIKKIKRKAKELGVKFRAKKDYIDFFIEQ